MTPARVKHIRLCLEPFEAALYVCTDEDYAHALSLELFGGESLDDTSVMCGWLCRDEKRPFCLVMYLSPEELEHSEAVLWHEALHVTTWLWHHAGAQLHVMYNDEVLTYYQGYVVRQVQKALDYKFQLEANHGN